MILTIAGADFSGANIGTNTTVKVTYKGSGVTNQTQYIERGTDFNVTITLKTDYAYNSLSIQVGTSTITEHTATDNGNGTVSLSIPGNLITGNVIITVNATYNGSGEAEPEEPGTGGDTPDTTTIRVTEFDHNSVHGFVDVVTGLLSTLGSSASQVVNYYDIPTGATSVNYPVFKTSKTYGSGFKDASGVWISGHANTTLETGSRYTLDIPSNAAQFVLTYPNDEYAEQQSLAKFDYIEFTIGGSGGSGETGDGEPIRITDFSKDKAGFVNATTGAFSSTTSPGQKVNYYVIPSGAKTVNYPTFKSSANGSGFKDASDNWISGYVASGPGRHTLTIPANASIFVLTYPDSEYATQQGLPVFDYIEFSFA